MAVIGKVAVIALVSWLPSPDVAKRIAWMRKVSTSFVWTVASRTSTPGHARLMRLPTGHIGSPFALSPELSQDLRVTGIQGSATGTVDALQQLA